MTILGWNDLTERAALAGMPVRLTVGVFDGLHLGHRRLMEDIARGSPDALPLVITFRQSPALLLAPESFQGFILSFRQKITRLEELRVGAVAVIDFSEEMSNLSGEDFVRILRENLTIQKIVVGQNFRFGKKRIAGTDDLKEMLSRTGIEVQVTEPVSWQGEIVSSSRIRTAIARGRLADAQEMLAARHAIDLQGIAPLSVGGGILRYDRRDVNQVLPPPGDYEVRCQGEAGTAPGRLEIRHDSLMLAAGDCGGVTGAIFT